MIIVEDDEEESVGRGVAGGESKTCADRADEAHVEGEDYYEMYVPLEQ